MPAVSVIVPSYNHAAFLERRLRSILDQTFTDLEVLVLDDASTDTTRDVLDSFAASPRLRIEYATVNGGSPFRQWNRGIRKTNAPLVWIAESDDAADPRLLETLVASLERHPSCGVAYAQSRCLDADGRADGTLARFTQVVDPTHWNTDYVNDGRNECASFLAVANTIPSASAVVFRRAVFERAGGAPEHMRLAGDWMTWLRMLLISDVAFVAEPLSGHRTHQATVRARLAQDARQYDEMLAVWRTAHEALDLPAGTRTRIVDIVRDVILRLLAHPVANRRRIADLYAFGCQLDPRLPRSFARLVGTYPLAKLASLRSGTDRPG